MEMSLFSSSQTLQRSSHMAATHPENEFIKELLESSPDKIRDRFNQIVKDHRFGNKEYFFDVPDAELTGRLSKAGGAIMMIPSESISSTDDAFPPSHLKIILH